MRHCPEKFIPERLTRNTSKHSGRKIYIHSKDDVINLRGSVINSSAFDIISSSNLINARNY